MYVKKNSQYITYFRKVSQSVNSEDAYCLHFALRKLTKFVCDAHEGSLISTNYVK